MPRLLTGAGGRPVAQGAARIGVHVARRGGVARTSHGAVAPAVAAVAVVVLAVMSITVGWARLPADRAVTLVQQGVAVSLAVVGLLAWMRRRRVALAHQVWLTGALLLIPPLRASVQPVVFAVAFCTAFGWIAPPAHWALSWPTGRLPTAVDRALVVACYATAIGIQTVRYLVERPEPGWLTTGPHGRTPWADVGSAVALVLTLLVVGRVLHRWARGEPRDGARPSDLVVASILLVGAAGVAATVANLAGVSDWQIRVLVPLVAVVAVPQAVLAYRRLEGRAADEAKRVAAERRRIHDDLHDEVQGLLYAAQIAVERARDALAPDAGIQWSLLTDAQQRIHEANRAIRDLVRGIYPAVLDERGLPAALRLLAERSPVPLVLDLPERRWRRRIEYNAYFAVSEMVTNALKHAAPTRIVVRVRDDDGVVITVDDDGAGSVVDLTEGGLHQLRRRLDHVGGRITELRSHTEGTLLTIRIPEA